MAFLDRVAICEGPDLSVMSLTVMKTQVYNIKDDQVLTIRRVEPDDAGAILTHIENVSGQTDFLSFGPGQFNLSESEERSFIEKCRTEPNHLLIIGLDHGTIVSSLGFIGGQRPRTEHTGEFGMSVEKQFWGIGIGSCMVETLLEWGKQNPVIKKINLRVRTDNRRAIQLYKHKGFRIEGTITRELIVNGQCFDHYWMGLEL